MMRVAVLFVAIFAISLAVMIVVVQHFPVQAAQTHPTVVTASSKPATAMAMLAAKVDEALKSSRPLLLGSRDPRGQSCVAVVHTGDVKDTVPANPGDWNGGPGTTMATLYYFDRQNNKSPLADYTWHQTRLKTYLQNESASNAQALKIAHELAEQSMAFYETACSWSVCPSDLAPVEYTRDNEWPSYCMAALDRAVRAHDLAQVRHSSGELAEAAMSLEDLHRWLGFLVENQLTALDFQSRCQTLFNNAELLHQSYDPQTTVSQFPAGVLSLNGLGNYYEVERQAERLFSMPIDRVSEITLNEHLTPASMWVVPGVRDAFLKLEAVLSPENQKTWEQAAQTPYQHSYLINMLYRCTQANTTDEVAETLKKLDARLPHATVGELTSVLMYRGHSFAGLEWSDRFRPELMAAADEIKEDESDQDALLEACRWTNRFYDPSNYGVTFTLRDALEHKRLDCVRATDMIGAIFRNAGRARFGHVRWCAETAGHSVAAYLGTDSNGHSDVSVADGLNPPAEPEHWPDAYFHGHAWPAGMTSNPTPYCVELYIRGLDSYIWAEGYIVRGPNAGELTTASIPYSTHRKDAATTKVFDGPYPQ
jgi:hypothetical protein